MKFKNLPSMLFNLICVTFVLTPLVNSGESSTPQQELVGGQESVSIPEKLDSDIKELIALYDQLQPDYIEYDNYARLLNDIKAFYAKQGNKDALNTFFGEYAVSRLGSLESYGGWENMMQGKGQRFSDRALDEVDSETATYGKTEIKDDILKKMEMYENMTGKKHPEKDRIESGY